jgi:beta-phosphoglucomutase-like phosphatase (HAD superfamily)
MVVWRDVQLVIFDCDGVLVDSETISNRVLADMLTAEGLPTTLTQARREYQGMLLADIRSRAEQTLGRALPEDWLAQYESGRDVSATQPTAMSRRNAPRARRRSCIHSTNCRDCSTRADVSHRRCVSMIGERDG